MICASSPVGNQLKETIREVVIAPDNVIPKARMIYVCIPISNKAIQWILKNLARPSDEIVLVNVRPDAKVSGYIPGQAAFFKTDQGRT